MIHGWFVQPRPFVRGVAREAALAGGEDYELLLAVPPRAAAALGQAGEQEPGHRAGTRRMLQSPQVRKLSERFPGTWANEWLPENEFGHWDGLRLRRSRSRYAIQMPKAAMDLDKGAVVEELPTLSMPGKQPQPSQG